ncbi:type I-E CRISPR-associated protein Cse1/CasA [Streptomyces sp. PU-14G]|uniref:type I-E CRISPR-associated protein Cse1/CasA n=1 Tax=Streptomyces sp. PU-14G TaxID=2800808 RepID=UPI0034DE6F09
MIDALRRAFGTERSAKQPRLSVACCKTVLAGFPLLCNVTGAFGVMRGWVTVKTEGFDLRDRPWIPVRVGGRSERVGLRELFLRAHEVEDLELPVPPAASGLMRILAAMTVRIVGEGAARLDDADLAGKSSAWRRLRNRVLEQGRFDPDRVREYFDRQVPAGRFDLFDAVRPFLQDPRLAKECVDPKGKPNPSGVNKLVLGRPTGVNGAVLFGHFTDREPVALPAAEAAWHMIAQLYHGPSGQCTPRRITAVRAGSGDAGPLRKAVSYFPWADSFFATLVLAVPAPWGDLELSGGTCPWEQEELPDPEQPVAATWPGRLLTGRARHAVLLVPSADRREVVDAYLTWSTHTPADVALDPFVIGDVPVKGGAPYARVADGARATWRDLDSLLMQTGTVDGKRPRAFERLPRRLSGQLRVRAYGFDQDGQQKDTVWYEATTPPVLQWQQPDPDEEESHEAGAAAAMAVRVHECHDFAETVGRSLEYAAMLAWKLTNVGPDPEAPVKVEKKRPGPWATRALRVYWPQAEQEFWRLVSTGHREDPLHKPFVTAALDALDAAIGPATRADLRVARARSRARRVLFKLLPSTSRSDLPPSP